MVNFVYNLGYGGTNGKLPPAIISGERGVSPLERTGNCLRAVNDNLAILRVYSDASRGRGTLEATVAAMTLREPRANCSDLNSVAADLNTITIPLLGYRGARALQAHDRLRQNAEVSECSCLVAALTWRLTEQCLAGIRKEGYTGQEAKELIEQNTLLLQSDMYNFRHDPASWLARSVADQEPTGRYYRLARRWNGLEKQSWRLGADHLDPRMMPASSTTPFRRPGACTMPARRTPHPSS